MRIWFFSDLRIITESSGAKWWQNEFCLQSNNGKGWKTVAYECDPRTTAPDGRVAGIAHLLTDCFLGCELWQLPGMQETMTLEEAAALVTRVAANIAKVVSEAQAAVGEAQASASAGSKMTGTDFDSMFED